MKEVQPEDIMLGNWFLVSGYPMYVDAIFRDTVYLEFEGNEGDVWEENIKDLVPVTLTEEILLKCGFKKSNKIQLSGKHLIIINSFVKSFMVVPNDVGSDWLYMQSYQKVYYLNQLQNIYKCLTNTDLKIDL